MAEVHTLRNLRVKALTLQSTIVNLNAPLGAKALRVSCEPFEGGAAQNPMTPNPKSPLMILKWRTIRDVIFYYIALTIIHQWLISYSG